ncbi:bifunctional folylpolyglutamate synthase/dihydrofolate synthase [Peribacillus sp. B-H-3]|uniref:bifunctional folylpolyglutamate synthase/dihydrofolate synthase n=1 Tax=Peribacillus sp. B-H-3 TaxID=3400420 RepID=UPI003B017AB7
MKYSKMDEINSAIEKRQLKLGMDFGLSRMEMLLARIGNPHRQLKYVHFAGSNGKGSTLNYMKEILITEGISVGAFTSPYLVKVNEQISLNRESISDEDFISIYQEIYPVIQEMDEENCGPTAFEILTVMALLFFSKKKPDIVLLETGLGGRLDSTNVVVPLLSVITSISLEHTNILGNTLEEIAGEKAGIIKPGVPVVTGAIETGPARVIAETAEKNHSERYTLCEDFILSDYSSHAGQQYFSFSLNSFRLTDVKSRMLGRHQGDNAALALAAVLLLKEKYGFSIKESSMKEGIWRSKWNGRFELLAKNPLVILDGAHNPAGMNVLLQTLRENYPNFKYRFVFSALKDKNYKKMLAAIENAAFEVIVTEFPHERAASAEVLLGASRSDNTIEIRDWRRASQQALQEIGEDELVIFTGSLYFLTLVRAWLSERLK